MIQYKIYRKDNYIVVTNNLTQETQYGFVKEVFIDKSNANKSAYRIFNVRDFDEKISLVIDQILKQDGSPYTASEFETFYAQNTGNFNSGGNSQGVQSVTGSSVDNTDPQNPIINAVEEAPEDGEIYGRQYGSWVVSGGSQNLQQTLDNGSYYESASGIEIDINSGSNPYLSQAVSYTGGGYGQLNIRNNKSIYLRSQIPTGNTWQVGSELGDGILQISSSIDGGLNSTTIEFEPATIDTKIKIPAKSEPGDYVVVTEDQLVPSIHIVPTGNFTVPDGVKTRMITLKDTATQVVTLPAIADAIGSIYFITNANNTGVKSIITADGNNIWDAGTMTDNKEIIFGSSLVLFNDGDNFKIRS